MGEGVLDTFKFVQVDSDISVSSALQWSSRELTIVHATVLQYMLT